MLVSATYAGYIAAIAAALLSGLAYNFFFIEPVDTFTIAEPHEVFAFFVFLVVATLVGGLASRIREQAKAAQRRATAAGALRFLPQAFRYRRRRRRALGCRHPDADRR